MAKYIVPSDDIRAKIREEFEKKLAEAKLSDSKFTFSTDIGKVDAKATVYFTEEAYLKMITLVYHCSSEIGWQGFAYRLDNPEENGYLVTDIMVYPQIVTGSTVDTDQEKYREWMRGFSIEEFRNVSFQGHSHVDFGATPSGDDDKLYRTFLAQLTKDRFYIFAIFNKKNSHWCEVYDMQKNLHFESSDVEVQVVDGDAYKIRSFYSDAIAKLSKPTYTAPAKTTYGGSYSYGFGKGYKKYDNYDDSYDPDYDYPYYGYSGAGVYGSRAVQTPKAETKAEPKQDGYRAVYQSDIDYFKKKFGGAK